MSIRTLFLVFFNLLWVSLFGSQNHGLAKYISCDSIGQGVHIYSDHPFTVDSMLLGWSYPIAPSENAKAAVYFTDALAYFKYTDTQWNLIWSSKGSNIRTVVPNYEMLRASPGFAFNDVVRVTDFDYLLDTFQYNVIGGVFKKVSLGTEDGGRFVVSTIDSTRWQRIAGTEIYPDWWENLTDTKRIEKAIEAATHGSKIIFQNRTYLIENEIFIDSLTDLHLDGRNAILKTAPGIMRNTTLGLGFNSGAYQITVSGVPLGWKKGDVIMIVKDSTDQGISTASQIDSINGNTIYLKYSFFNIGGGFFPSQPGGTKVIKSITIIRGRPSATEGIAGPEGHNKGTIIENFTFDGNREEDNEVTFSWVANNGLSLHGRGSEIRSCKFINFPAEVITGHGINVHNNVFENCGGSVYHLSAHDNTFADSYPAYFVNNTVINCNTVPRSINGHNEGLISFSWNGGYAIINGNYFVSGSTSNGVIGTFTDFGSPNDREIVILTNNYCKGFERVVYDTHQASTRSLAIIGNIFEDCQTLMTSITLHPSIKICGNVQVGTTNFGIDFRNSCDYQDVIDQSIGYGKNALKNTTAFLNAAFGNYALEETTSGNLNVGFGDAAGKNNITGEKNVFFGSWTGISMTDGNENTIVGHWARGSSTSGNRNVHLGTEAGRINNGDGNVFIGYKSGIYALGDDNLIIHNSETGPPLIQGKFGDDLQINGNLKVNGLNFLRLPRLNETERGNLNGLIGGEMIYNLTTIKVQVFDGSIWLDLN